MRLVPALALAALLAAPGAARGTPEAELASALRGRVADAPVPCIRLSRITNTLIIDRIAILYRAGGRLYVNRPTAGAQSLDAFDVLQSRPFAGQLCRGDPVQRLNRRPARNTAR